MAQGQTTESFGRKMRVVDKEVHNAFMKGEDGAPQAMKEADQAETSEPFLDSLPPILDSPVPTVTPVLEKAGKRDFTKLEKNQVLIFGFGPSRFSGVVHVVGEKGLWTRPDLHKEVDLSHCTFYNWAELGEHVTDVV